MMKKQGVYLLAVSFLLILFLPHAIWQLAGQEPSAGSGEKRTLAQKPAFSLKTASSFPQEYEAYYNDHMPFRDTLIQTYSRLMYDVFHASASDKVIVGREGWLFYNHPSDGESLACYNGEKLLAETTLQMIADNLVQARDMLAAQNTEFVLLIAPEKERMYSEYMPEYLGEPAQHCMINQVVDYLREYTDLNVVYAYDALMAYKDGNPLQALYRRTDTHWNNLGAYIAAEALLESLGMELPEADELMIQPGRLMEGDLAGLLNLHRHLPADDNLDVQGYAGFSMEHTWEEEDVYRFETDAADGKRLLLIRDSFGEAMIPFLASRFAGGCVVHRDLYRSEIRKTDAPDVLVYEVVERAVPHMMFLPAL